MTKRTSTNKLIVHCSDTYANMDIGVKEVNQWHLDRGWSGVGYHFVIRRDGTVENGRGINEMGAHCRGYNAESIGICLVGGRGIGGKPEDNFTQRQLESLEFLIESLEGDYPGAKVFGHNELNPHKACPSFNVQKWFAELDDMEGLVDEDEEEDGGCFFGFWGP
jgi:N-acetyl-anhydromuramyl-L-alanine amidase AmpD